MSWDAVSGKALAQGDWLPGVLVPVVRPDFLAGGGTQSVDVYEYDLIIATHSCDLENAKVNHVVAVQTIPIVEFEKTNVSYRKRTRWNEVRKGRIELLYLLSSPESPDDNTASMVADFRSVHSLPIDYLHTHAEGLPRRHRLQSPYLEHFSQAFARVFMRVALPRVPDDFR